jgi:hypothetical protein
VQGQKQVLVMLVWGPLAAEAADTQAKTQEVAAGTHGEVAAQVKMR